MTRSHFGSVVTRPGRPGHYVRFQVHGSERLRYGGVNWKAADKKRRALQVLIEQGVEVGRAIAEVFGDTHGATYTFRKAVKPYLEHARSRKKASTYAGDVHRLGQLARAAWAAKTLGHITTADLQHWVNERHKSRTVMRVRKRRPGESLADFRQAEDRKEAKEIRGASGATLNRDLNLVSALYSWAMKLGYVESNPAKNVERFSEKGRAREIYLTAEEARALVDACSSLIRLFVQAALHTGMRRGELLALAWHSVDLTRKEIVVRAESEKAGRGRVVPMTGELHAAFAEARRSRTVVAIDGSDRVFLLADGRPMRNDMLRRSFASAVARCSAIPVEKRQQLSLHSLRHTAASLMVAAGVPIFDVAKILGHSTLAVTMRYAHFAPAAGRSAIDKLGDSLAGKPAAAASASGKRVRKGGQSAS